MTATASCPLCKRPAAHDGPTFPFCTQRCKLLDMGNWLDGRYVVTSPLPFDEALDGNSGSEPPDVEPS